MSLILSKVTLIITTRCNLRCKLCCEYVPMHKPFPDMTVDEEKAILNVLFNTVDRVETLHLSGGGEPFLHKQLPELIDVAFEFQKKFDRFMLFTNCTVAVSNELDEKLRHYGDKIIVQCSRYGVNPEKEEAVIKTLKETGATLKIEKYYGENQSFGGWVDFGKWESQNRKPEELFEVFHNCAVTRDMRGNWRTRDGKVHWCSRSQRGNELGFIPNFKDDYVDLFDNSLSREQKREKFERISQAHSLSACDYCSGNQGTSDKSLRFPAAEQLNNTKKRGAKDDI